MRLDARNVPLITESTGLATVRVGEYEPGDGKRYTAVALRWETNSKAGLGALGHVRDGWLVTYGNNGKSYLLQRAGVLVDDYLAEKFSISDQELPHAADLLRRLLDR